MGVPIIGLPSIYLVPSFRAHTKGPNTEDPFKNYNPQGDVHILLTHTPVFIYSDQFLPHLALSLFTGDTTDKERCNFSAVE